MRGSRGPHRCTLSLVMDESRCPDGSERHRQFARRTENCRRCRDVIDVPEYQWHQFELIKGIEVAMSRVLGESTAFEVSPNRAR
jgi:hypothetical protein